MEVNKLDKMNGFKNENNVKESNSAYNQELDGSNSPSHTTDTCNILS